MKIIVDTNIVFSAILNSNSRIGKILLNSKQHFQFYSCNYLRAEIHRHRNKLMKLTGLSENNLSELEELITQNIAFIDERLIPRDLLLKTETQLKAIDPNDTVFVALTKHFILRNVFKNLPRRCLSIEDSALPEYLISIVYK